MELSQRYHVTINTNLHSVIEVGLSNWCNANHFIVTRRRRPMPSATERVYCVRRRFVSLVELDAMDVTHVLAVGHSVIFFSV